MKEFDYIIWREDDQYVSKCLNVEIASCGDTKDEALKNLKEALELYYEEENEYQTVSEPIVGRDAIYA